MPGIKNKPADNARPLIIFVAINKPQYLKEFVYL